MASVIRCTLIGEVAAAAAVVVVLAAAGYANVQPLLPVL